MPRPAGSCFVRVRIAQSYRPGILVRSGGGSNASVPAEHTFIGLSFVPGASPKHTAGAEVLVDRSASCATCGAYRNTMAIPAEAASQIGALRIFVDHSVITVFTASGRVLTARVYPDATSTGVWLVGGSLGATFAVTAWAMAPPT